MITGGGYPQSNLGGKSQPTGTKFSPDYRIPYCYNYYRGTIFSDLSSTFVFRVLNLAILNSTEQ